MLFVSFISVECDSGGCEKLEKGPDTLHAGPCEGGASIEN